jgi:hypothetical protein
MSFKGQKQTSLTKYKIGLANQKDRAEIDKHIEEYINGVQEGDFPTITEASLHAHINEKNLIIYEEGSPDDSTIRRLLDTVRDLQKTALIKGGLSRKYDSKITTLLLKAHHGLKEEPTHLEQNNFFNGLSPELLSEAISISRNKK